MPAVSKRQQRLMGMAYACKKSGFKKCASKKVMKIAQSMKEKDLKDFASTKTKNLPERKKTMHFKEWLNKVESVEWIPPNLDKESGELELHTPRFGMDADEFRAAIEGGELRTMDDMLSNTLNNTQMRDVEPGDKEGLISIGKENKKNYKEIMQRIEAGKSLYAPIVVHKKGSPPWLVAGNTRLAAARAYNVTPKIWYVKI